MTTVARTSTTATLTSKGQLTIPKRVREQLKLKSGDRMDCAIDNDGSIKLRPLTLKVDDVFGSLGRIKKPKRANTSGEMDAAIVKAVRKRVVRNKRGR
jgi:AbrB family looped-hinge helix DNA binding protein